MRVRVLAAACALAAALTVGACSTESPLDPFDAVEGFERAINARDFDKACRDYLAERPLYEPSEPTDRELDTRGEAAAAGGCLSLVRALYDRPDGRRFTTDADRRETSLETATAVCSQSEGEPGRAFTLEQVDGRWRIQALPSRPCKL